MGDFDPTEFDPAYFDTGPAPHRPVIYLCRMTGEVDAMLTPDGPCPFWNDLHTENLTDGTASYDFSIPSTREEAAFAIEEERVVFPDLDEVLRAFVVKKATNTPPAKVIHTEPLHVDELGSLRLTPATFTSQTAAYIAGQVIAGSGWEVGTSEWAGVFSMTVKDEDTPLAALQALCKLKDPALELDFRVTFDGNRITHRYVDIYLQRGRVTNLVFEYGGELKSVTHTVDSSELYTAMKGLGKADSAGKPLTLETAAATSDHEADSLIVTDEDALQRYGFVDADGNRRHRVGTFTDPDETSVANLLVKTRKALAAASSPKVTIDADIVDLSRIGFDWRRVRLGDTVVVRDTRVFPAIDDTDRITETRVSYTDKGGGS